MEDGGWEWRRRDEHQNGRKPDPGGGIWVWTKKGGLPDPSFWLDPGFWCGADLPDPGGIWVWTKTKILSDPSFWLGPGFWCGADLPDPCWILVWTPKK